MVRAQPRQSPPLLIEEEDIDLLSFDADEDGDSGDFAGLGTPSTRPPPYHRTISSLREVQWIQCPIQKLNHIHHCLKFELAAEIDTFYDNVDEKLHALLLKKSVQMNGNQDPNWHSLERLSQRARSAIGSKKDRVMDIDTLQSLCIYLVRSMGYAHLISDNFLICDFLSYSVKLSSRCIFLNVIKGAIDCILDKLEEDRWNESEAEFDLVEGLKVDEEYETPIGKTVSKG